MFRRSISWQIYSGARKHSNGFISLIIYHRSYTVTITIYNVCMCKARYESCRHRSKFTIRCGTLLQILLPELSPHYAIYPRFNRTRGKPHTYTHTHTLRRKFRFIFRDSTYFRDLGQQKSVKCYSTKYSTSGALVQRLKYLFHFSVHFSVATRRQKYGRRLKLSLMQACPQAER